MIPETAALLQFPLHEHPTYAGRYAWRSQLAATDATTIGCDIIAADLSPELAEAAFTAFAADTDVLHKAPPSPVTSYAGGKGAQRTVDATPEVFLD